MKRFYAILLCCAILLQTVVFVGAQEDGGAAHVIYVSAFNGNDSAAGTETAPYLTVKRAQEEARKLSANATGDIVIELAGGTYYQSETLCFDDRDSGKNGHRVIYRSKPGENAVISGGKRIENWTVAENGTWQAKVESPDYIRELYVNGTKKRLARTENKIPGQGYYIDKNEPGVQKGVLLDKSLLDGIEHPEDMVFRWSSAWMCYALLCEGIVNVNETQSAALLQYDYRTLSSREANPIRSTAGAVIENALKFMDTPGEFYYDRHADILHYFPEAGETIETAEIIVPVLEKVVSISGSDSEHLISGVDFENLTFSHGAWNLPAQFGYNPVQAQWIYTADFEIEFTPSNITVSFADDIGFYGNTFTGLGCVGLGLNEMASNVKIVGNSFYDIKDSAISVGLLTHEYIAEPEEYLDVARNKPTSASSFSKRKHRPSQAVNPISSEVSWQPAASDTEPWVQVDLENETNVAGVSLLFENGGMGSKGVLLSNDESFENSVAAELESRNSEEFVTSFAISRRTGTRYLYRPQKGDEYRYVRIYVNPSSNLNEIKVYDKDQKGIALEGVCSNNLISNNYITRVADYFWSSPGITAYYVDHLEISNNHLEDLPYSGISLGWGWIFNTDSTTCHDNLVKANYISNIMTECYDGGGIYTLGQQPGTKITENYVNNCFFEYGVLYLDGGSVDIEVMENVVEDSINYFMNSPADGTNDVHHNYVTNPNTTVQNPDTVVRDATEFAIGMPTAKIHRIMNNSGLQKEYRYLLDRTPAMPEDYDAFGSEGYINRTDTSGSSGMAGLISIALANYETALKFIRVGDGLWEYPEEAVDAFRTAVFRANGKKNEPNLDTAANLYKEWEKLREAYDALLQNRNKLTYDELLSRCKNALALAQSGNGRNQYPKTAIDEFSEFLASDINYVKNDDKYLHLEQAYMAFLEQKQNLAIIDVENSAIIGEPVIDNINNKVTVYVSPMATLNALAANFVLSEGCKLSDQTAKWTDFSKPVTLVVKNQDETAYRFWEVEFKQKALSTFGE